MYIFKKYTFYEKDLLTLVRTNIYLSYDQKRMNSNERDKSLQYVTKLYMYVYRGGYRI